MQEPASFILVYAVFPLWVAAGFLDWLCHVRTSIALTSGLKENLLHWLMFVQIGVGIAAVVLLEINQAILLLVIAIFLVHELTVYWDLNYSTLRRDVGPFEQMVHSFLELLPLLSLALLVMMIGSEGPTDWTLRLRAQPLPTNYLIAGALFVAVFNVVPLLAETYACVRAKTGDGPTRRRASIIGDPSHSPAIEPTLERVEPVFKTPIKPIIPPDNETPVKARTPANPGPR